MSSNVSELCGIDRNIIEMCQNDGKIDALGPIVTVSPLLCARSWSSDESGIVSTEVALEVDCR